jgi:transposase
VPVRVRVRDELGEAFAGAFGREGRPGWSPGRLALITVLQRVGNLTDRQAAEAVATDLTWKYALGLSLDDPGFDASVLSEFRSRVIAHELEEKPLDLLLAALQERGLLAAGGKQRTDSTHVVSAVRDVMYFMPPSLTTGLHAAAGRARCAACRRRRRRGMKKCLVRVTLCDARRSEPWLAR